MTTTPSPDSDLLDFLSDVKARALWTSDTAVGDITMYSCNGRIFMVMRHYERTTKEMLGWEIYAPVSESINQDRTLGALFSYINGGSFDNADAFTALAALEGVNDQLEEIKENTRRLRKILTKSKRGAQ
jgi:hypothetical protein|tara:strand:+ start:85 stop:471 length:387 start_codon:yes stop_codon:yes gene_type:complete